MQRVKLGIDMETKKKVAIKIMREQSIIDESSLELFINEVKILSQIAPNENIVQLQRVCLSGKYTKCDGREFAVIYYVMKIAENGELFKFLMHTQKFEEDLARFFFKQIIESIEYLHDKGIAHRDIKPENIVISRNLKIKLCDFGFSVRCRNDQGQHILFDPADPVGSPEYNPPEVTQKIYTGVKYNAEQMDLFSSACVLFMMVMSSAPFGNTSTSDRYYSRFCMENKTNFWKIFAYNNKPTNEFKDFMHCMLEADPQKRITIQQIKAHPWMNGPIPSLELAQQQMNERISIVFNKTLDELKQKIENKNQQKKDKPRTRPLCNIEGLKNKYHKQIQDINLQIVRKIQNIKKQKILMKQAQPEQKDNIPHPLEECLLKQREDYIIEFQDQTFAQQLQRQYQENNEIGNVSASFTNSPLQFIAQSPSQIIEKEQPIQFKIDPILQKSTQGHLEESKSDNKPAHVEEKDFNVAPIKKSSWQSKDDSYFSSCNKNQKIAAVQFNNDFQFSSHPQFDIISNSSPQSAHQIQNSTSENDLERIHNCSQGKINNIQNKDIIKNKRNQQLSQISIQNQTLQKRSNEIIENSTQQKSIQNQTYLSS